MNGSSEVACSPQSLQSRSKEDDRLERLRSNNKLLVLNLLAAAGAFGITEGLMGLPVQTPRLLEVTELIAVNFILFYWFMVDSGIRDYNASGFLKFMVVVFPLIALSWYVIRTRGVRGSIRSFMYALGLFILSGGVYRIVAELTSVMARHGVPFK